MGKFYYFYDALCGWCYGFSRVMNELTNDLSRDYEFEIISGGMVTADRIGPITHMADYISQAHLRIEEMSGVKFGTPFTQGTLYDEKAIFSSIEPSRALVHVKQNKPEVAFPFATAMQQGIFVQGRLPTDHTWYTELSDQFGLDATAMQSALLDHSLGKSDFDLTQQFTVQSFPTLVLHLENSYYLVGKGYTSRDSIDAALSSIWASIE